MPHIGTSTRPVSRRWTLLAQRPPQACWIALLVMSITLSGCHMPLWNKKTSCVPQRISDVELQEYREWAIEIDFPDLEHDRPPPDVMAIEPRRLRNLSKDDIWDMTLQEVVKTALSNCRILRSSGQFLSPGNPILANPEFATSSYDIAIQETGILFGQRGIEAALAEFDTQFTTTMTWGSDERIQNSLFNVGLGQGQTLQEDTAAFRASLQKQLATGGIFALNHDWNYEQNNVNNRLFPSVYTGQLQAQFRQPLLAGAGVEYTRIAGPISQNIQGVSGVQQGVVIARINNDITVADFELGVTNVVNDVERLYWQLYLAYQQFDAETALHQEALKNWRSVNARVQAQAAGGGAIEEGEATELYLQIESRVYAAHNTLYDIEAQLRRMMGLPPNDGRIIRPIDEPIIAELSPDWQMTLSDALTRRVELRKQKWNIKKFELQLIAAKNLVKPRLDFVTSYNVNAFGDDLFGERRDGMTTEGLGNAYQTLSGGDQTGWDIGLEFSLQVGMREARSQVRNQHIRLVKARDALYAQEIEVSHELAASFRELDRSYLAMQNNLNRKVINERSLRTLEAQREATPDRVTIDAILRARDRLVQSQSAFLQAVVQYNIAIMDTHFRSGTLLDLNNVYLAEGPWTPHARFDAVEKAAARNRTIPTARMLHSEPAAFAHPVGEGNIGIPLPELGPAMQGFPLTPTPDSLMPVPELPPIVEPPAEESGPSLEPAPETPPQEADPPPYLGPIVEEFRLPTISTQPLQAAPGTLKRPSGTTDRSVPSPEIMPPSGDNEFKPPIRPHGQKANETPAQPPIDAKHLGQPVA